MTDILTSFYNGKLYNDHSPFVAASSSVTGFS